MSRLYPLTKDDVSLEIKGVLQDGGTDILNFVLSEVYAGKIVEYGNEWCQSKDRNILQRILDYNEDDCLAMMVLKDRLQELVQRL